jgi:ABC-type antimicrobial peptide transport system permease subunit
MSLCGVIVGALGAFGLTRFLAGMLFGVSPTEPRIFLGVAALLVLVTLAACYIPARRASRVDPIIALRSL